MTAASPRRSHTETGRGAATAGTAPHWPPGSAKDGRGPQWGGGAGSRQRGGATPLDGRSLAPRPLPAPPRSRPLPPAPLGRSAVAPVLSAHSAECAGGAGMAGKSGTSGEPRCWPSPSPGTRRGAGGARRGHIRCCGPAGRSFRPCVSTGRPPHAPAHTRECVSPARTRAAAPRAPPRAVSQRPRARDRLRAPPAAPAPRGAGNATQGGPGAGAAAVRPCSLNSTHLSGRFALVESKGRVLVSSGNDPGPAGGSRRGDDRTSGGGGKAAPGSPACLGHPAPCSPRRRRSLTGRAGAPRGGERRGRAGGARCRACLPGPVHSSPGGPRPGSMSAFLSPPPGGGERRGGAEGPRPGWAAGGAGVCPARIFLCEAERGKEGECRGPGGGCRDAGLSPPDEGGRGASPSAQSGAGRAAIVKVEG